MQTQFFICNLVQYETNECQEITYRVWKVFHYNSCHFNQNVLLIFLTDN